MGYTPPYLYLTKGTGLWNVYGQGGTTDDLIIYPNLVDTATSIALYGTSSISLAVPATKKVQFLTQGVGNFEISYATPDVTLASTIADKNLSLVTAGTGLIKFGAYTAGAATDSTGYITILDAAGNTRKLMVQA